MVRQKIQVSLLFALFAAFLAAGNASAFSVAWSKKLPEVESHHLALKDGRLFIISGTSEKSDVAFLLALDAASGEVLWRAPGIGYWQTFFVGGFEVVTNYGDFEYPKKAVSFSTANLPYNGGLMALDARTGAERWRVATPRISGTGCYREIDEDLLCGSVRFPLLRLRRGSEEPVWSFNAGEKRADGEFAHPEYLPDFVGLRARCGDDFSVGPVAATEDALFVSSSQGMTYKLDKATGKVLEVKDEGRCRIYLGHTTLVEDNAVYWPRADYRLEARSFPSMAPKWNVASIPLGVPVVIGRALVVREWGYSGSESSERVANSLVLGEREDAGPGSALRAYDRETGELLWDWGVQGYITEPVAFRGLFVVGTTKGELVGLDPKTGQVVEKLRLGGKVNENPVTDGKTLYVLDGENQLRGLR